MLKKKKNDNKRLQQDTFVLCYKVLEDYISKEIVENHFKLVLSQADACENIDIFVTKLDPEAIHSNCLNHQNNCCYLYVSCKWRTKLNLYYNNNNAGQKEIVKPNYLAFNTTTKVVYPTLFPYNLIGQSSNVRDFSFKDYINSRTISNQIGPPITVSKNLLEKASFKTEPVLKDALVLSQNKPLGCFNIIEQLQPQIDKLNLVMCFAVGILSFFKLATYFYFRAINFYAYATRENFNFSYCQTRKFSRLYSNKSFLLKKTNLSNYVQLPMAISKSIVNNVITISQGTRVYKTMLELAKFDPNLHVVVINHESLVEDLLLVKKSNVEQPLPLKPNQIGGLKKNEKPYVFYLLSNKTFSNFTSFFKESEDSKPLPRDIANPKKEEPSNLKKEEPSNLEIIVPKTDSKSTQVDHNDLVSDKVPETNRDQTFAMFDPQSNLTFEHNSSCFKKYSNQRFCFSSSKKSNSEHPLTSDAEFERPTSAKRKLDLNSNIETEVVTQIQPSPKQPRTDQNQVILKPCNIPRLPLQDINQNVMPPK